MKPIFSPRRRRRGPLWFAILALTALTFAAVAAPVWMIRPFGPQTPTMIAVSYWLRRITPIGTIVVVLILLPLAGRLWERSRWVGRVGLALSLALAVFVAWFSWQNHFEWMFRPLPGPGFVAAPQADFVQGSDLVFGVERNGDASAYPVRQIAYHHVVQDSIGGEPVVVTY